MTNTTSESIAPVILPERPDYRASSAAFREYARICARLVLVARTQTKVLGENLPELVVARRSWPKGADQSAAAAAALDRGDFDAFIEALGAPESVQLSEDGRAFATSRYCWCDDVSVTLEEQVYVERWSENGREFHGWVHRDCRYLTQTG